TFPTGRGPTSIASGDFNRDGNQDLVVTNYGSADYYYPVIWTTVSVLLGNGDGTFQAAQQFEAGSGPNAVAVADFNGDAIQDLAVTEYFSTNVSVLLGNPGGTFQDARHFGVDLAPISVAVGDFNGDGQPDLVTTNYFASSVTVLTNK